MPRPVFSRVSSPQLSMPVLLVLLPMVLLPLVLLQWACAEPETATEAPASKAADLTSSGTVPSKAAAVEVQAAETDPEVLLRTARRLAGLEVPTPVADEDAEAAARRRLWLDHAEAMESLWTVIEDRHLQHMRQWGREALAAAQAEPRPIFYPFGGPDLPSVHQFFPDAPDYVLVGLEPAGTLPNLAAFSNRDLEIELERLRDGLSNLAEKGYFVARHMVQDFGDAQRLEGFVPVLYIFLVRSGYLPIAARFFELEADGTVRYPDQVMADEVYAVELMFVPEDDPEASPRRLIYAAQDLSNEGLAAVPGFAPFVRRLGAFDVYMKSAMYLPHEEGFEDLQALMFEGRSILQDDSGVPWEALNAEPWETDLFGVYDRTLANYRQYFQPELAAAYGTRSDADKLPFAIGYNSRLSGSCLMWARRKGAL